MKRILILIALLVVPASALADAPFPTVARLKDNTNGVAMLTAAPLNVTQTVTARLSSETYSKVALYTKVKITVDYVFSAASAVQIVWKCSTDQGVTFGTETRRDPAAANTLTSFTDQVSTGSANFTLNIDWGVKGCTDLQIVFTSTGGDASDVITVTGTASSGS